MPVAGSARGLRWSSAGSALGRFNTQEYTPRQAASGAMARLAELQVVDRAAHGPAAPIENVRVDHGGLDVLVAKEFLHRADVLAVLEKMGGKGMPRAMAAGGSVDSRLAAQPPRPPSSDRHPEIAYCQWPCDGSDGPIATLSTDPAEYPCSPVQPGLTRARGHSSAPDDDRARLQVFAQCLLGPEQGLADGRVAASNLLILWSLMVPRGGIEPPTP